MAWLQYTCNILDLPGPSSLSYCVKPVAHSGVKGTPPSRSVSPDLVTHPYAAHVMCEVLLAKDSSTQLECTPISTVKPLRCTSQPGKLHAASQLSFTRVIKKHCQHHTHTQLFMALLRQ